MKIVLAEVPYTKDRDISVEKSCVPEGAELTMAVFDEHAENNDAFYAEIKDADIIMFNDELALTYVMQMGREVTNELA